MKIAIIGGLGFIGASLTIEAIRRGFAITSLTRNNSVPELPCHSRLKFLSLAKSGDLQLWKNAVLESDFVIDATGYGGPSRSSSDPANEVSINLKRSVHVIDSLVGLGAKKIVLLSSAGTVYGPTESGSATESWPLRPLSFYGATKAALEAYANAICATSNVSLLVLRVSNPYGPLQMPGQGQGLIANALESAWNESTIKIWGSGNETRDYIYIDDAIDAILEAALHLSPGTFNVAFGASVSTNTVLDVLDTITGHRAKRIHCKPHLGSPNKISISCDKISKALLWRPKICLAEGAELTWKALINNEKCIQLYRNSLLSAAELRARILALELGIIEKL